MAPPSPPPPFLGVHDLGSFAMGNAIHPVSGAGNPCILAFVPVTSSLPRISSLALRPASSPFRFLLGAPGFLWHLPQASPLQTPLWATTLCQTLLPTPGSTFLLPAISPLITHCLVFFAAWPSLRVDPQTGQFSSRGIESGFL